MNTAMLKSIMALNGDTIAALADFLGKTPQSVSDKINERGTEFKQGEIARIKERYRLNATQIEEIFFN